MLFAAERWQAYTADPEHPYRSDCSWRQNAGRNRQRLCGGTGTALTSLAAAAVTTSRSEPSPFRDSAYTRRQWRETVIYSMGVSLDCSIAGPDGNDWGPLMPSYTASTTSRQASSASIYSDDASTR